MSVNYSANQYESAFVPKLMQNWQTPKQTSGIKLTRATGPENYQSIFPARRAGFTNINADYRGHLLPNVPRKRGSPWGNYVGTWDMPRRIPGHKTTDPMNRTCDAQIKLHMEKEEADEILSGALKPVKMHDPLPQRIEIPPPPPKTPPVGPGLCYMNFAPPTVEIPQARLPDDHKVMWPCQKGELPPKKDPRQMSPGPQAMACPILRPTPYSDGPLKPLTPEKQRAAASPIPYSCKPGMGFNRPPTIDLASPVGEKWKTGCNMIHWPSTRTGDPEDAVCPIKRISPFAPPDPVPPTPPYLGPNTQVLPAWTQQYKPEDMVCQYARTYPFTEEVKVAPSVTEPVC